MDKGLEDLVEQNQDSVHWGRRKSDAYESLPGHDSYTFLQQLNESGTTATIPPEHISGILQYVEALKSSADHESYRARHDALTTVPNRLALEEELRETVIDSNKTDSHFTYIFFDIDDFKKINTDYTHEGGDQILRALGEILTDSLRPGDKSHPLSIDAYLNNGKGKAHKGFGSRVGGEEFVLLIKDTDMEQGLSVAHRIKNQIQEKMNEYHLQGKVPSPISVSMGVSNYTGNASNVHDVIQRSKDALMHAKGISGKGQICYYNPETKDIVQYNHNKE